MVPTIPGPDEPENLVEFSDHRKVSCSDQLCLILCLLRVEFFCRTKDLDLVLGVWLNTCPQTDTGFELRSKFDLTMN